MGRYASRMKSGHARATELSGRSSNHSSTTHLSTPPPPPTRALRSQIHYCLGTLSPPAFPSHPSSMLCLGSVSTFSIIRPTKIDTYEYPELSQESPFAFSERCVGLGNDSAAFIRHSLLRVETPTSRCLTHRCAGRGCALWPGPPVDLAAKIGTGHRKRISLLLKSLGSVSTSASRRSQSSSFQAINCAAIVAIAALNPPDNPCIRLGLVSAESVVAQIGRATVCPQLGPSLLSCSRYVCRSLVKTWH